MIKSFALLTLLTSAAFAQSSSSSAPAASASATSRIPTGISDACKTYLTALDSDAGIKGCTDALVAATSSFGPGSTITPTSDTVTSTLGNLCSAATTAKCPDSTIRQQLTNFYAQCTAELTTNRNDDVVSFYEILYDLLPFKTALCSQDDSGTSCVLGAKASSATSGLSGTLAGHSGAWTVADILAALGSSTFVPNLATFASNNIPFLFASTKLDASQMCTPCTRNILTAYIQQESDSPYAPGLENSPLLSTQSSLYASVVSKCGDNFMNGAVQAAGGIGSNSPFSSSSGALSLNVELQNFFMMAMGAATLAISSI